MRVMTDPDMRVSEVAVGDFAKALASSSPTPGGGAATAVTAVLAASLTAMVVRLSVDRPKYEQHTALHTEALADSDEARERFMALADSDAAAYAAYRAARSLPRDTEAQEKVRSAAVKAAAREAAVVPLTVVKACHQQIDLVERLAGRTNLYVASDLEVAALLLEGAARGAASNVIVNLPSVGDEGYGSAVTAELAQRLQQIQSAADRTRERIAKGGLRKPESE